MKTRDRIISFFYELNPPECVSKWWHAMAYRDLMRRRDVMVIWPFHYVVQLAFWLNLHWFRYRHQPSWIDGHIDRYAQSIREENDRLRMLNWDATREGSNIAMESHKLVVTLHSCKLAFTTVRDYPLTISQRRELAERLIQEIEDQIKQKNPHGHETAASRALHQSIDR